MDTVGRHLLVEYWGCDAERLNDRMGVERLMRQAADAAGATVVNAIFHAFSEQGVTGVVMLEESHLSIHTWPERGYAAVDFYTCGDCQPERARDLLGEQLGADSVETLSVVRGERTGEGSLRKEAPQPPATFPRPMR